MVKRKSSFKWKLSDSWYTYEALLISAVHYYNISCSEGVPISTRTAKRYFSRVSRLFAFRERKDWLQIARHRTKHAMTTCTCLQQIWSCYHGQDNLLPYACSFEGSMLKSLTRDTVPAKQGRSEIRGCTTASSEHSCPPRAYRLSLLPYKNTSPKH